MLPHDFATEKSVFATCITDGFEERRCAMCGEMRHEDIKAYGHKFDGGKCLRCGELDAGSGCETHIFGPVETVVPATCEAEGKARRICKVCQAETVLVTPKSSHKFKVTTELQPTCTEDGMKEMECSLCGKTQQVSIPKIGHNVVGGECTICKEKTVA